MVLPFLFVTTGSAAIAELHDRMVVNPRGPGGGVLPVGAVAETPR